MSKVKGGMFIGEENFEDVEPFRHRGKGGLKMGTTAAEENFEDVDEYRFYEKKSNQQIFVVLFVLLILYVKRNSIKKYLK